MQFKKNDLRSSAKEAGHTTKKIADNEPDFETLVTGLHGIFALDEALKFGLILPDEIPPYRTGAVYEAIWSEVEFIYALRADLDSVWIALGVDTARRRHTAFRRFLALVVGEPAPARRGHPGGAT